jgi:hypothetical protein
VEINDFHFSFYVVTDRMAFSSIIYIISQLLLLDA